MKNTERDRFSSSTLESEALQEDFDAHTDHDLWTVGSGYTFSHNIGMLSGKVILAIGKAQVSAMNWVWVRYRRNFINRKFSIYSRLEDKMTCLGSIYDDLIDFSRCAEETCRI
jgi:hypothetical protein